MTIYCDIDGTLTDLPHAAGGAPRKDVIERLKLYIKRGHSVILWSANGAVYVEQFASEHGIEALACLKKPDMIIDDKKNIRPHGKDIPVLPEEFLRLRL